MQRRSMNVRKPWHVVVALAVLVTAGTAHAQEAGELPRSQPDEAGEALAAPEDMPWIQGQSLDERKRAREIFLEGNVLLADTLFARAAVKYEQALAIWAHPAFFYNLALARIHLDQPIEAYESMRQAVRHGPEPLGEDLYQNAQNFLALLDGQLAEIEVVCDEPEATVTLDGKPLFVGPGRRTLMALPGGHMLMATKNGRLPDAQQVILAPGEQARFSLAPPYPEALATERRWSAWVPWAVVGAGAVVMTGGAYLDWRSSTTFARYDRGVEIACPGNSGCDPGRIAGGLREQQERAEMQQWTARGVYLAGGAAVATGAVLLYLNRERPVRRRGLAETSDVSLVPVLAPHAIGVGAGVTF
jgi:hypothetical protein